MRLHRDLFDLGRPSARWWSNNSVVGRCRLSDESRVYIDWDADVREAALKQDLALDPNGYVAPASMVNL